MATRPPHDVALDALTAQVADLRGTVTALKARMDAAGVSGSAKLHERVTAIEDTVATLNSAEAPAPRVPAPMWAGLDDTTRAAQLDALRAWVDTILIPHYAPKGLRRCWAAHMPAVWELSTLAAEWRRVYERKHPDLAGALQFYERWLPGTAGRLDRILDDCKGQCSLVTAPALVHPPRAG
jgi:hypothetical protein